MRDIIFKGTAFDDFNEWNKSDKKTFNKLVKLIEETRRNPFMGTGKPEPLRHQFAGCWSRRINDQHRLIYIVTYDSIDIVSCRFHY